MAKKGIKRKQKTEVVKEEEPKVILPLVRRSDEPVTKRVIRVSNRNTTIFVKFICICTQILLLFRMTRELMSNTYIDIGTK